MTKTNLLQYAENIPQAWKSVVIGWPGLSQFKILRMDGCSYPAETHSLTEALLVLDGQMNLEVNGEIIEVKAGEVYMVPEEQTHSVAPGSHGTLIIIDSQT